MEGCLASAHPFVRRAAGGSADARRAELALVATPACRLQQLPQPNGMRPSKTTLLKQAGDGT